MSETLSHGSRLQTFNSIADFNQAAFAIEMDTSLPAERLIRAIEHLKTEEEVRHNMIRVDTGPEFLAQQLQIWGKAHWMLVYHIQPGRPTQNAFIEQFNRTYRNEVFKLYRFRGLEDVREITAKWLTIYNEQRPHEALKGGSPLLFLQTYTRKL